MSVRIRPTKAYTNNIFTPKISICMKSPKNKTIPIIQDKGTVIYSNNFLLKDVALDLYNKIRKNTEWAQYPITMFGKTVLQPRLIAWHGTKGTTYSYSNTTLIAEGWTAELLFIKRKLKEAFDLDFNSVLLNLYRDGQDSMGWHSDDEKELGQQPSIASVSLGCARTIQFRQRQDHSKKASVLLESGSLLLMQGDTQKHWQHQIAKSKKINSPRINLTFRIIHPL